MAVEDLEYVKIAGRFGFITADAADADALPDHVFADSGEVTFTPTATSSIKFDSTEGPITLGLGKIVASIGADGRLTYNGNPFVWLVDPTSPKLNPRNWTYRVEFKNIKAGENALNVTAFTFQPVSGVDNDLTTLAPSASSPGVLVPAVTALVVDGETYTGTIDLDQFDFGSGTGGAVASVNGQTGVVVLDAEDVSALPSSYTPPPTVWGDIPDRPATFTPTTGTTAGTAAAGNDARLFDQRVPTANSVDNTKVADGTLALSKLATNPLARSSHTGTQTSATISDLTEAVQDIVGAFFGAGTGAAVSYNDAANTITVSATGTTDPEAVRDAIGAAMVGVGNITVTVNDAADTITVSTTATANSTDAALRDRTTHTGAQAISTITGLQTELDEKLIEVTYADLPPHSTLTVHPAGGAWPARPTARADVVVRWVDDVDTPLGTAPAGALAGVDEHAYPAA